MKQWYQSRTVWLNLLSLVAMVAQMQFGFVISPEVQGAILIILNLILRFDTNTSININ